MTSSRSTGSSPTATEGVTTMTLPTLDPTATRYALRAFTPWFLLAVAGVYVALGVLSGTTMTFAYAGCFLAFAGASLYWRYQTSIEAAVRAAQAATYAAERAERMAEHEEAMRKIEQARKDALQDLEAAVRRGERCPDDCTECAVERAEADADTRAWLASRAARHGHLA